MDEREAKYRLHAAECLEMARITNSETIRATLLSMAQGWVWLADQARGRHRFDGVLQQFRDSHTQDQ
jgi:hypothetical protein